MSESALLRRFKSALRDHCDRSGSKQRRFSPRRRITKRTANVVELESQSGHLILYVLTFRGRPGFWNISGGKIEEIISCQVASWWVVLLEGPNESGYLLTNQQVTDGLNEDKWTSVNDGYKLHPHNIPRTLRFNTFNRVFEEIGA